MQFMCILLIMLMGWDSTLHRFIFINRDINDKFDLIPRYLNYVLS